jgi:hypothetical protein
VVKYGNHHSREGGIQRDGCPTKAFGHDVFNRRGNKTPYRKKISVSSLPTTGMAQRKKELRRLT